ncbi:PAS domain-containing sensor histidine kinase [Geomobilimonas luticola]|nr:ATP-binding protein [Geomobilimonas luticola]
MSAHGTVQPSLAALPGEGRETGYQMNFMKNCGANQDNRGGWREKLYQTPSRLIVVIALAIFITEMGVMVVLHFFPATPQLLTMVLDSIILLIFLAPILRSFVFKPLENQIERTKLSEASLLEYKLNLESLVDDRTARLTAAVKNLETEIAERTRAEEALQKSEERFRQLFQQTEDAIILFKPGSCRIIDINPVAEKLYGFTKQELFVQGPSCFVKEPDLERFCEIMTAVTREDRLQIDRINHLRKDGSEIVVSIRGKVVTIQNVDLVYCSIRNISARIRLEDETRLIQAKLIHTNKMASLGVLVAGIAHEINNPNNFILINSEILGRACKDIYPILRKECETNGDFMVGGIPCSQMIEHFPEVVSGIRDGSIRIRDIINNLKDFARNGTSTLSDRTDLNRAVSVSVSILNHQIRKHTRNFRLDLAESLPPVTGNAQQLEQVIMNLIVNSLQSLPSEEQGVTVTTFFDTEHNWVVLKVADEGQGIPDDIADRVLDPFFTTRLDSGGSGLGLAICYSIVRDHKGQLDFESLPGKGTTFTVRLPAALCKEPGDTEI